MHTSVKSLFLAHTQELINACSNIDEFHSQVETVSIQLAEAFAKGNKVLIAGNGGSAAEAQHFSDELIGRYRSDRQAYPVIALTADSMVLTCIGNDYGYDNIFSRQVDALGKAGDVFIGLTTSGDSQNILNAAVSARKHEMKVIALCGNTGSLKDTADLAIISPSSKAAIVQELHLHAIHLICETLEPR